jgi:hypothetical protein
VRENSDTVARVSGGYVTDHGKVLFADSVGARVPTRARAQVHSVFPRACNMKTESGELLTLLAPGFGNLPHGIRCASPIASLPARLRRGQAAILAGATIRIPAADISVDFSAAGVWNGLVAAASPGLPGAVAQETLRELRQTLREHAPAQGIAPALFCFGNRPSTLERALAARMAQTLPVLARATETSNACAVIAALRALVGLGTGLTPSGDDFIAGYLAALWSRSHREPGICALLHSLAVPVGRLLLHTNAISRQMVRDALQGHFGERLVEVVRCVCSGGDVAGATMRALEVGHSSGADVLCGLLFGYLPTLTARQSRVLATEDHFDDGHSARAAAIAC